jgi:hypothetical protein
MLEMAFSKSRQKFPQMPENGAKRGKTG